MLSIIGMIIAGAVIGALARLIMRGEQNISVLWTIVLGAVGALIGSTVAGFFGVASRSSSRLISEPLSYSVSQKLQLRLHLLRRMNMEALPIFSPSPCRL